MVMKNKKRPPVDTVDNVLHPIGSDYNKPNKPKGQNALMNYQIPSAQKQPPKSNSFWQNLGNSVTELNNMAASGNYDEERAKEIATEMGHTVANALTPQTPRPTQPTPSQPVNPPVKEVEDLLHQPDSTIPSNPNRNPVLDAVPIIPSQKPTTPSQPQPVQPVQPTQPQGETALAKAYDDLYRRDRQYAQAQEEARYNKLLQYLPEYNDIVGLRGAGVSEQGLLNAQAQHSQNMANIGMKYDALNREYAERLRQEERQEQMRQEDIKRQEQIRQEDIAHRTEREEVEQERWEAEQAHRAEQEKTEQERYEAEQKRYDEEWLSKQSAQTKQNVSDIADSITDFMSGFEEGQLSEERMNLFLDGLKGMGYAADEIAAAKKIVGLSQDSATTDEKGLVQEGDIIVNTDEGGINVDTATEADFGSHMGSGKEGTKQNRLVSNIIKGAKEGRLKDGDVVNVNYGFGGYDLYVYHNGKLFKTSYDQVSSAKNRVIKESDILNWY